jgi:cardiolipin synthase
MQEIKYILSKHLSSMLSISRVILGLIIWILLTVHSNLAFPIFLVACITDVLDGILARFLNSATKKGAALDATADYLLVSVGFFYYISLDLVSPLLLAVMTISFLQYILTFKIPIKDHMGKYVGTILYILLAAMILSPTPQNSIIINFIGVFYTTISIINRLYQIIKNTRTS